MSLDVLLAPLLDSVTCSYLGNLGSLKLVTRYDDPFSCPFLKGDATRSTRREYNQTGQSLEV